MADELRFTLSVDDKGVATIKNFSSATDKLNSNVKTTGSGFDTFGTKLDSAGSKVSSIASKVMALAGVAGLSQLAKEAVSTGAIFEQTMLTVGGITQTIVDGQVTPAFYNLVDAAREAGASTEWSATQSGQALQFLGMAGFEAEQAIAALPGVLDLATAGQIDLGRSADIASNALTAMGLDVSELSRVNDVFVGTITSTNTNMDMMAESFKYAAPKAKAYGYDIETLSAMIGALGNAGIQGSMAGTQLAFAIGQVGNVFEAAGMDGTGKDLIDALKLINEEAWDNAEIMDVFGERGGRAVLVLKDMIPEVEKLTGKLYDSEGAAKELADTMRSSLENRFKVLKSVIQDQVLTSFETYKGDLKELVQDSSKWIGDHTDQIQSFLGVITGGMTDFLSNVGNVVSGIGSVMSAFGTGSIWEILEQHPSMAEYGLVGYFMWGRKGAAVAVGISTVADIIKNQAQALGLIASEVLEWSDLSSRNFEELDSLLKSFDENLQNNTMSVFKLNLEIERTQTVIEALEKAMEFDETGYIFSDENLKKLLDLKSKLRGLQYQQEANTISQNQYKDSWKAQGEEAERVTKETEKLLKELEEVSDHTYENIEEVVAIAISHQVGYEEDLHERRKLGLVDYKDQTKEALDKVEEFYESYYGALEEGSSGWVDYEIKQLEEQYEAYREVVADKTKLDEWYLAKLHEILKKQGGYQEDNNDKILKASKILYEDLEEYPEDYNEIVKQELEDQADEWEKLGLSAEDTAEWIAKKWKEHLESVEQSAYENILEQGGDSVAGHIAAFKAGFIAEFGNPQSDLNKSWLTWAEIGSGTATTLVDTISSGISGGLSAALIEGGTIREIVGDAWESMWQTFATDAVDLITSKLTEGLVNFGWDFLFGDGSSTTDLLGGLVGAVTGGSGSGSSGGTSVVGGGTVLSGLSKLFSGSTPAATTTFDNAATVLGEGVVDSSQIAESGLSNFAISGAGLTTAVFGYMAVDALSAYLNEAAPYNIDAFYSLIEQLALDDLGMIDVSRDPWGVIGYELSTSDMLDYAQQRLLDEAGINVSWEDIYDWYSKYYASGFPSVSFNPISGYSLPSGDYPISYYEGDYGGSYHSGGMIRKAHKGMYLSKDEVPFVGLVGEGVLNRRAMNSIGGEAGLNALNSGSSGGILQSRMERLTSRVDSMVSTMQAFMNKPIELYIDGKRMSKAVFQQTQRGIMAIDSRGVRSESPRTRIS